MNAPRFDLIGGGGFGWVGHAMPRPKRHAELESAIDGQGEAGDGGESARRAAWIAGWRGVLKAIDAAGHTASAPYRPRSIK